MVPPTSHSIPQGRAHAPLRPRANPARQTRLHHGGNRGNRNVRATRRTLEPRRAAVPQAGPEDRRRHRDLHGEQRPLPAPVLGRAAFGPLLHLHVLAPDGGRDRIHRQGLRRESLRHLQSHERDGRRSRRTACRASRNSCSAARRPATTASKRRSAQCPQRRSPTKRPAPTCSTHRARRAGPRASSAR